MSQRPVPILVFCGLLLLFNAHRPSTADEVPKSTAQRAAEKAKLRKQVEAKLRKIESILDKEQLNLLLDEMRALMTWVERHDALGHSLALIELMKWRTRSEEYRDVQAALALQIDELGARHYLRELREALDSKNKLSESLAAARLGQVVGRIRRLKLPTAARFADLIVAHQADLRAGKRGMPKLTIPVRKFKPDTLAALSIMSKDLDIRKPAGWLHATLTAPDRLLPSDPKSKTNRITIQTIKKGGKTDAECLASFRKVLAKGVVETIHKESRFNDAKGLTVIFETSSRSGTTKLRSLHFLHLRRHANYLISAKSAEAEFKDLSKLYRKCAKSCVIYEDQSIDDD